MPNPNANAQLHSMMAVLVRAEAATVALGGSGGSGESDGAAGGRDVKRPAGGAKGQASPTLGWLQRLRSLR